MITIKQISDIISEKLHGSEIFPVEIIILPGNHIKVFLDSDTSVKIADCAKISRLIESGLNRDTDDFELEVSSAGLDRPLKMPRQYLKNIGNELRITTRDKKSFTASLLGVNEKSITVLIPENKKNKIQEEAIEVPFDDIAETKVNIKINNKR